MTRKTRKATALLVGVFLGGNCGNRKDQAKIFSKYRWIDDGKSTQTLVFCFKDI
jgi:hypothetical protein